MVLTQYSVLNAEWLGHAITTVDHRQFWSQGPRRPSFSRSQLRLNMQTGLEYDSPRIIEEGDLLLEQTSTTFDRHFGKIEADERRTKDTGVPTHGADATVDVYEDRFRSVHRNYGNERNSAVLPSAFKSFKLAETGPVNFRPDSQNLLFELATGWGMGDTQRGHQNVAAPQRMIPNDALLLLRYHRTQPDHEPTFATVMVH